MSESPSGRDAHEAHVQMLTAEVRTLVVGSRQVTMSVYSQLDEVPPSKIVPFGRVNPKDASERLVYVVGRHATDGALVSSWIHRDPGSLSDQHWDQIKDSFVGTAQKELAEIAAQWAALPLIVLAGLR